MLPHFHPVADAAPLPPSIPCTPSHPLGLLKGRWSGLLKGRWSVVLPRGRVHCSVSVSALALSTGCVLTPVTQWLPECSTSVSLSSVSSRAGPRPVHPHSSIKCLLTEFENVSLQKSKGNIQARLRSKNYLDISFLLVYAMFSIF